MNSIFLRVYGGLLAVLVLVALLGLLVALLGQRQIFTHLGHFLHTASP